LFRYKAHWVDGVPDQNDFSLRGIAFHACAHNYIMRLVELQIQSDADEARAAFKEAIAESQTPAHLVPEVHEIFLGWAEHFELDLQWFMAAEQHEIGKNQHTFTPDLVYARPTGLEIVDFKTYWVAMTEEQIRNDFQSKFYIYNARRIWPNFPTYTFTHSYVRFGSKVSVQFTENDLAPFADEVEAIVRTIQVAEERDEWPATPGPECAYCSLACPVVDNPMLVPKRLTVPEQAVLVGGTILAMEAWVRTAKKALKAYCAGNGPITVKGVEFDNRPVMQRSYPIDQVLAEMKALGVDADAAVLATDNYSLTISHSALAKIFRAYPMLEERLQVAQRQKLTYRFGAKKPGADEDEDPT
jgi:hypothetical protein